MESPLPTSFAVTLLVVVAALTVTPLPQLADLLDRLRRWSPLATLGQLSLATAIEPVWPVVTEMPPRPPRRPRRNGRSRTPAPVPVERTRPVTAVSPDAAVFDAPQQLPPGPPSPPRGEVAVGDVVSSSEQPVLELEPSGDQLNVVVNVSYARSEHGQRAVRILDRRGTVLLQLTAAQAHQLALDLTQSADVVGSIRVAAGYDS